LVRGCVCEVLEASARHLDKLINVDEFLRRIMTVMHSNDPVSFMEYNVNFCLFLIMNFSIEIFSSFNEICVG